MEVLMSVRKLGFLTAMALLMAFSAPSLSSDLGDYKIASGDILKITVFQEEDLSLEKVRVDRSGAISFPLLGDIKVAGHSTLTIEKNLEHALLQGYLKKPRVSVSVIEYRFFYVNGEVNSPGGYPFRDGLTIEKAVALAGGFNDRASKEKITLVREQQPDTPIESVGLKIRVNPGDIITVGESFF